MNSNVSDRQESDRVAPKGMFSAVFSRPEIGPIGVMLLLFGMLGYFSIPAAEATWNPFAGEGFQRSVLHAHASTELHNSELYSLSWQNSQHYKAALVFHSPE